MCFCRVTREYRESLAKKAKAHFIKCRDNIKNVQNKHTKDLKKKEKGLSEDDCFLMAEQVLPISQIIQQYFTSG